MVSQPKIKEWMQHIQVAHELDDGTDAYYHKGFKYHCLLKWDGNNFFRGAQLESLRAIYNTYAGLCVYTSPDKHPDKVYVVRWVNDFDFALRQGMVEIGYNGTIELVGTAKLSEVDSNYPMANTF
jgi:hypothetical protein